jgi:hypothetical protein
MATLHLDIMTKFSNLTTQNPYDHLLGIFFAHQMTKICHKKNIALDTLVLLYIYKQNSQPPTQVDDGHW